MIARVKWSGTVKDTDDFGSDIEHEFIDGRTKMGPWAIMSPDSFAAFGVGIGTGLGQRYEKYDDGFWWKVEG